MVVVQIPLPPAGRGNTSTALVTTKNTVTYITRSRGLDKMSETKGEVQGESKMTYCLGCQQRRLCQEYHTYWFCLARCWKSRRRRAAFQEQKEAEETTT